MEYNKIEAANLKEIKQHKSKNFTNSKSILSNRYVQILMRQLPLNKFNLRTDSQIYPREDQAEITETKKNKFIEALRVLFKNGQYAELVVSIPILVTNIIFLEKLKMFLVGFCHGIVYFYMNLKID